MSRPVILPAIVVAIAVVGLAGASFTKVVLASYRLPDGNFVSFHGATDDVRREALLIAAAHHMRLKR